ncbi:unnamed protein product [Paramecium sonneborni]|uniref:Uncharacterized protein n=1 Tax=Paramecium sonneborni TaxID=65129 RepID=A0A8S1QPF7_9CILI|nr:unnamed protein product [Paramecium sonneborni]
MERTCLLPEHQGFGSQIIGFCVTECCRKPSRALCFKCMTGPGHQGHQLIQAQEENAFLAQPNRIFTEINQKLELMIRQFSKGIKYLQGILQKNYQPQPLSNFGNSEITEKINCILKLETVQKLINDRLDNIFENTLKQIKITCQDLTLGEEFKSYEFLQHQKYQEASQLINQCFQRGNRNTFLKLAQAEIFKVQDQFQDARAIYLQLLQEDDSNPWAYFENNKMLNQQERR